MTPYRQGNGIYLKGNPITEPPREVIEKGFDGITAYFEKSV